MTSVVGLEFGLSRLPFDGAPVLNPSGFAFIPTHGPNSQNFNCGSARSFAVAALNSMPDKSIARVGIASAAMRDLNK